MCFILPDKHPSPPITNRHLCLLARNSIYLHKNSLLSHLLLVKADNRFSQDLPRLIKSRHPFLSLLKVRIGSYIQILGHVTDLMIIVLKEFCYKSELNPTQLFFTPILALIIMYICLYNSFYLCKLHMPSQLLHLL